MHAKSFSDGELAAEYHLADADAFAESERGNMQEMETARHIFEVIERFALSSHYDESPVWDRI